METTKSQRMTFWWSGTQFVLCLVFTGNFLYLMREHLEKDREIGHKARCVAREGINHPITVTKNTDLDQTTNVGDSFFVCFVVGLILNILTLTWSLASCFMNRLSQSCNYAMQTVIFIINNIFLVAVTYMRFCHAGKVCSGDYSYYPISLETRKQGILGIEGQFLVVFIVTGWLQFALMLIFFLVHCLSS